LDSQSEFVSEIFCGRLTIEPEKTLTRRKRRNDSRESKAKVTMAATRGDKTLAGLAQQYDVQPNQIKDWKKRLTAEAGALFESGGSQAASDNEEKVADLHSRIGELTMERDFLFKALGRGR